MVVPPGSSPGICTTSCLLTTLPDGVYISCSASSILSMPARCSLFNITDVLSEARQNLNGALLSFDYISREGRRYTANFFLSSSLHRYANFQIFQKQTLSVCSEFSTLQVVVESSLKSYIEVMTCSITQGLSLNSIVTRGVRILIFSNIF